MAGYLAMRINDGAIDYNIAISKYPQFKDEIDRILKETYNYKKKA